MPEMSAYHEQQEAANHLRLFLGPRRALARRLCADAGAIHAQQAKTGHVAAKDRFAGRRS